VAEALTGAQFKGTVSAVAALKNCTVPDGPKPRLVVFTVAVRVTGAPESTVVALDETMVVVAA
jgi:hypothetical protein